MKISYAQHQCENGGLCSDGACICLAEFTGPGCTEDVRDACSLHPCTKGQCVISEGERNCIQLGQVGGLLKILNYTIQTFRLKCKTGFKITVKGMVRMVKNEYL